MIVFPDHQRTVTSELCQFFDGFREREPLSVLDWALKWRYIAKGVSPKPGKYTLDNGPYQGAPQQSFTDPTVQVTVMMWASRLGKTEVINNLDGYIVDHDPKGILVVYPTLDSATKWSKKFFMPMVKATPRLRGKIKSSRTRDSDSTILSKSFIGGAIDAIGTNSPSGFRQIQAPVVRADEIDAMEDGKEGDPITLAFRRADNYSDSIQVLASTPTVKGASRIESWMEKSDYQMWFCPCVECGRHQVLKWAQVQWPDDQPEEARYVCEFQDCQHAHTDEERIEMVRNGEWRPTRPFRGVRGYWLNGINTLFEPKKGFVSKLHQMAQEFLDAKYSDNPQETMRVWVNTFLAETWAEKSHRIEAEPLLARREAYGKTLPEQACIITAGVDIQEDRIEAQAIAWGEGEESWPIDYQVFMGKTSNPAGGAWLELDRWLQETYEHPLGISLGIERTCIDTGKFPDAGYAFSFARQLRGVYVVKGIKGVGLPVMTLPKKSGIKKVRLWMVSTNTAKSLIYSRLQQLERGAGYIHFPFDREPAFQAEYFRQLTSEQVVEKKRMGKTYNDFEEHGRNEALDTFVYALGALKMRDTNFAKIAQRLKDQAAEARVEQQPVKKPVPKPQSDDRGGGFVGGFRRGGRW